MKLYGIFNLNDNNKLLRYSTDLQAERTYIWNDPVSKSELTIHEICLPDIEYSEQYIGKKYNIETGIFEE